VGILTAVFLGIAVIILVARTASRSIPRGEQDSDRPPPKVAKKRRPGIPDEISHLGALVAVLVRKGVITEEELMEEISRVTEDNELD